MEGRTGQRNLWKVGRVEELMEGRADRGTYGR